MKFRLHPLLIFWFIFLFATGQLGFFSAVFISLLFHELGHLAALKFFGVQDVRCILYPFGARIEWDNKASWSRLKKFIVYFAGPLATLALIGILLFIPVPVPQLFFTIQYMILLLNLLPFYPLDGGGMVTALLGGPFQKLYRIYVALMIPVFGCFALISALSGWWMVAMVSLILFIENYRYVKS
ncbi:site-2 protease family protein [Chryseomicrobium palamuruense]|uniref:Site-2 protease family protein n=1 Tax=Chryseomicrobium palamuruense TaxID=682973 RepID=A0ABV8V047_9BACL